MLRSGCRTAAGPGPETPHPKPEDAHEHCSAAISPRRVHRCGALQYRLGPLLRAEPAMALPVRGHASAKLSRDLCLPGYGHRSLRDPLPGGGARSRTRLAHRCGWTARQSARADWLAPAHLDGTVAHRGQSPVHHQRFHLVASLWALSVRCSPRILANLSRAVTFAG